MLQETPTTIQAALGVTRPGHATTKRCKIVDIVGGRSS